MATNAADRKRKLDESSEDEISLQQRTPNQMISRPVKKYNQDNHSVQRYCTEFNWVLRDWSLLYDVIYREGVKSEKFEIEGINEGTCEIYFCPKASKSSLLVVLSNSESVLALKIIAKINKQPSESITFYHPIENTFHLQVSAPIDKKDLSEVLSIAASDEAHDALNISISFVVARFPEFASRRNETGNGRNNISDKIETLLNDKILCDVTFILGDKEFPAHKNILGAHSKIFEVMFSSTRATMQQGKLIVHIFDTAPEVFEAFLIFLYTGRFNNCEETVEEMIRLAYEYEVIELKILCESFMLNNICPKNVVKYILIADQLSCIQLKKKAINFLADCSSALTKVIEEADSKVTICLSNALKEFSADK